MKINLDKYQINKDDYLIIGVSGGSDSMSLLDIIYNSNYHNLIVCHVNYHRRDTALRDELIVKEYCASHSIIFTKLDNYTYKKNFQDDARNTRYNFFYENYVKYNAKALLIAHQQNDCLETYLFKKNRGSKGRSLSINEIDYIYNMRVIRPLLNYKKKELEQYCVSHSIKYGVDESNLENHYSRNIIRNINIANMSEEEYDKLISEMNYNNKIWNEQYNKVLSKIINNSIKLVDFQYFNEQEKEICLIELINNTCPKIADNLHLGRIKNYIEALNSNGNKYIELEDDQYLVKHSIISIEKLNNKKTLKFNSIEEALNSNLFTLEGNKTDGIYLDECDFPITLRTYQKNDKIILKEGKKDVWKLFKDKKINKIQRLNTYLLLNNKDEILLIPGLYRSYKQKDWKNNIYMIK